MKLVRKKKALWKRLRRNNCPELFSRFKQLRKQTKKCIAASYHHYLKIFHPSPPNYVTRSPGQEEVEDILLRLNVHKASGVDGIPARILKIYAICSVGGLGFKLGFVSHVQSQMAVEALKRMSKI